MRRSRDLEKNSNKEKMEKSATFWISLSGAIIVLIGFFLPWIRVGFTVGNETVTGLSLIKKDLRLWLIPILAVIAIQFDLGYLKGWWKRLRTWMFITGGLGLFIMGMTYNSIDHQLNKFFIKLITRHQIKIGLFGTIIGFFLIFITAFLPKRKLEVSDSREGTVTVPEDTNYK
jgi:hypothetical protein